MRTARQVLFRAAAHIKRYGHAQRTLGYVRGPCCVLGARNVAAFGHASVGWAVALSPARTEVREETTRLIARALGIGTSGVPTMFDLETAIVSWNDRFPRTAQEAYSALHRAAEAAPK